MTNLPQDLEMLRKLNESRLRAKELREQALHALKQIEYKKVRPPRDGRESPFKDKDTKVKLGGIDFGKWVAGNDEVEIALLVKLQNHRDISQNENENNKPRSASPLLQRELKTLDLEKLLQQLREANNRSKFPVLLAARAMQALVTRAETVFSPATMYCYYRIIRELYGVAHPNWTIGAARAGIGGTTSAFVTNECIRAIFAFERALERTYQFFEQTSMLYEYFSSLDYILKEWKIKRGPLFNWANKSIEARWLDCQIATNSRNREMALFHSGKSSGKNALLLPDANKSVNLKGARLYFKRLPRDLEKAVNKLFQNVAKVHVTIEQYRSKESPNIEPLVDDHRTPGKYVYLRSARGETEKERKKERVKDEKITQFIRSATAHSFALKAIENAVDNARDLQSIVNPLKKGGSPISGVGKRYDTGKILKEMAKKFYTIRRRVHHVLEPSKQYLKWVLGRELAAPAATFDAGELVFAATSYGAINNWRLDDRLNRACERLINSLPDNGRLPTKRPFHADRRGYRTVPIGCEMTRALATLLQKTGYHFDATFVSRMLGVFEEQLIELHESTSERPLIGWNFEGAPNPEKPAVWVTAVSVLALDRIVRMLNTRINEVILAYFDVTQPERPHTELTLRDLIYSDYALERYGPAKEPLDDEERLTAIHVQKARAHVMRATLPERYRHDNKNFSTIYYGPPSTGKTTLAESLAFSARVPFLRLSPGDLILQGQELIEGRAHDVFEALSMLTQCVIIFDEFEPVLKNRGDETKPPPPAPQNGERARSQDESKQKEDEQNKSEKDELAGIRNVLQNISQKDDPKFRFVLGGMLPKFIKLHDSAERQSCAYCLGTNYLKVIDTAAKRRGRFDKRIPVYRPDALSRAGALLYWLSQGKGINVKKRPNKETDKLTRFFEVIARTAGESADRISKSFKIRKNENGENELTETLEYILYDRESPKGLKALGENLGTLENESFLNELLLDKNEGELMQREWICKSETHFVKGARGLDKKTTRKKIIQRLNESLRFQVQPKKGPGVAAK